MWAKSEPIYRQTIASPAKAWRTRFQRYRLLGNASQNGETIYFPPRLANSLSTDDLRPYILSRFGKIIVKAEDYTPLIAQAGRSTRLFAMIQLEDGPSVMAEVVGSTYEALKVGNEVEMVVRKWRRESNGLPQYGFKFRLRTF